MNPTDTAPTTNKLFADADARSALRHGPSYVRFLSVAVLGLGLDLWSKHWAFHTLGQGNTPRVVIPHVLEFQTMLNPGALFGIGGGQTVLFLIASALALLLVFWMFSQTSARRWALHFALGGILAGALGNMYDRATVKLIDQWFPHGGRHVYTQLTRTDETGSLLEEYPPHGGGAQFQMLPAADDGTVMIRPLPPGGRIMRLESAPAEVGFVRDFIKIPTRLPKGLSRRFFDRPDQDLWPWVFNVADMLLVGGVGLLAIHLWRDRKHPHDAERKNVDGAEASA